MVAERQPVAALSLAVAGVVNGLSAIGTRVEVAVAAWVSWRS